MDMAYFQMDKNPIKELETEADFKNWSKGCYRQAEMFYKLCYRCRDMLLSETMDWTIVKQVDTIS